MDSFWIIAFIAVLIAALGGFWFARAGNTSGFVDSATSSPDLVQDISNPSLPAMYASGRKIAASFFSAAKTKIGARGQNILEKDRAHMVSVFAYFAPKLVLSMKWKSFDQSSAGRELRKIAFEGFKAVEQYEAMMFQLSLPAIARGMIKSPEEMSAKLSEGMVERVDHLFAECSSNLIKQDKFPFDPLYEYFDGIVSLSRRSPRNREITYRPLLHQYYAIWSSADTSGIVRANDEARDL